MMMMMMMMNRVPTIPYNAILLNWVAIIGNCKILGVHFFSVENTVYTNNYHKHVFAY